MCYRAEEWEKSPVHSVFPHGLRTCMHIISDYACTCKSADSFLRMHITVGDVLVVGNWREAGGDTGKAKLTRYPSQLPQALVAPAPAIALFAH
jgi:hypothetical protein